MSKMNKMGATIDTRFTTIGVNNDSKTNPFFTNNLASLNTIENEKQSTIWQNGNKKKYINNFNTIDDTNNEIIKTKRHKDLKNLKNNYDNLLPIYYNFGQPIIRVFARILDIDYICNCEEACDQSWMTKFIQIYKECMKNETPIEKIEISNCHTMVLNSVGKIYSWGWNNFGQCGVFPNLTKESYVLPNKLRNDKEKFPNLPVINYKSNEKSLPIQNISNMVLNDDFSIILTQKGNAILFGDNSLGQLGQGHRMDVKSAQTLPKFKNKIKSVHSSGNMNLILTKKN
jgi:alpha-tubulin suppressor-like RCC1 family protein